MNFEERLECINNTLTLIANLMQSGHAMGHAVAAPVVDAAVDTAPEKKTRAKKADPVIEAAPEVVEAKKEVAPVVATPSIAPAVAPVSDTPVALIASVAAADVQWKAVLAKLLELNKSLLPGHGRDGVLSVIAQFPGPDGKPVDVVPKLESIGKHREILAFVDALLNPVEIALF